MVAVIVRKKNDMQLAVSIMCHAAKYSHDRQVCIYFTRTKKCHYQTSIAISIIPEQKSSVVFFVVETLLDGHLLVPNFPSHH